MSAALRHGVALAFVLFASIGGCDGAPERRQSTGSEPIRLEDAEGRVVALPRPAVRVVSLVPSVTETIVALGAGDRLVGRTDFDVAENLSHLPSVGGGLGPNLESLIVLAPDLVVRFAGGSDRTTPDRLDAMGTSHVAVRPDRIDDVWTVMDQIGALLGMRERSDHLRDSLRAELETIRASAAGRAPVRVVYLMGGSPPWTAGAGTYIDELIRLAGGTNVFSDLDGLYGAVSPERVVARDVDVVLLADGAQIDPRLLEGRIVRRLSPAVEIPGPHLVDAAREVAAALAADSGGSS